MEYAPVGGEAGDGDTDVIVGAEDLALVGGEVRGGLVDGGENGVGARAEADGGGALLDGLHGVLDLEEAPGGAPCGDIGVVLVAKHPLSVSSSLLSFLQGALRSSSALCISLSTVLSSLSSFFLSLSLFLSSQVKNE